MLKFEINNENYNWPLLRQVISLSLYSNKPVELAGAMDHISNWQSLHIYDDLKRLIQQVGAGSIIEKNESIIYNPKKIEYGLLNYESHELSSMIEIALFLFPSLFQSDFRSVLNLKGVTHSHLSYPTIYMKNNILHFLEKLNFIGSLTLKRFGFYGSGGGEAELRVYPVGSSKKKVSFTPSKLKISGARIIISQLNTDLAANEKKYLMEKLNLMDNRVSILEVRDSDGPGNSIQVFVTDGDDFENPLVFQTSLKVMDEKGELVLENDEVHNGLVGLLKKSDSCVKENRYPEDMLLEILPYCLMSGANAPYDSSNKFLSNAESLFKEFIE